MPKPNLTITSILGRNGADPPLLLSDTQAQEVVNVELGPVGMGRKRYGSTAVSLTCFSGGPIVAPIYSLFRHVKDGIETQSEIWALDGSSPCQVFRLAPDVGSGVQWTEGGHLYPAASPFPTLANAPYANACSFNGKLFFCWDHSTNNMNVWDGTIRPGYAGGAIRFVGLGRSDWTAPTCADYGSGSYAATLRYYKQCNTVQNSSGVTLRRSPESNALTFTPSGSGTGALVTRSTTLDSFAPTHWELYGSDDDVTYYLLGTRALEDAITAYADGGGGTVTATTTNDHSLAVGDSVTIWGSTNYNGTFTVTAVPTSKTFKFTDTWVADDAAGWVRINTILDTTNPGDYTGTAIPETGLNESPYSHKYVATTGNRLLLAGYWEDSTVWQSRVWFTPVLGAGVGDDERVPTNATYNYYIDLDESDGGVITGLVGQFQGISLVFKSRQVWKLIPTGIDTAPFRAIKISSTIGAVSQKSIVEAEDENGEPAVYFLSPRGPYRYGVNGFEYLGHDIEDKWALALESSDSSYLASQTTSHGLYYPYRRQVWWFYRVPGATMTDACLVLNIPCLQRTEKGYRGGWAVYDLPGQYHTASVSHANTLGTTNSTQLSPFVYVYTP